MLPRITKSLVHLLEGRERGAQVTGVGHHEIGYKIAASVSILGTARIRFAVKKLDVILLDSLEDRILGIGRLPRVRLISSALLRALQTAYTPSSRNGGKAVSQ